MQSICNKLNNTEFSKLGYKYHNQWREEQNFMGFAHTRINKENKPLKRGTTVQQLMHPRLVNCPSAASSNMTGKAAKKIISMYGMRKAPVER